VTCPACDTSHWADARPFAGALVSRNGKLLLVRRARGPWKGAWDLPGGFCGVREHPRQAAVREVRHETALEVEAGAVVGMWLDSYAPSGPGADKITLNIYFSATLAGTGEPQRDPGEVAEIGWFAPDELPEPLAFPGHLPEALRAWRASQERPSRTAAPPPVGQRPSGGRGPELPA
jgi:ADP-ribose pyrophosphatase YjhB (NUDIX family)